MNRMTEPKIGDRVAQPRALSDRRMRGLLMSGVLAGAVAPIAFALIHDLLISDIWYSAMMFACVACGLCLGWTYGFFFRVPSLRTWLAYNTTYVALFAALGIVSVFVFEPVTTIPALIAAGDPPDQLFGQAMPLTALFTVLAARTITWSPNAAFTLVQAGLSKPGQSTTAHTDCRRGTFAHFSEVTRQVSR